MAQIKAIEMDDDENPAFVTVRMSIEEAAFVARFTGMHNDRTANEIMPNGAESSSSLFQATAYNLFNRFYDDGVDEYLRERGQ